MKYLIIGNSAAAVGCVAGIRQNDKQGSITIVAKESEHTYSRPLITYLLGGKVGEDDMYYRPADFYEKNGVEAILGAEVTAIDAAEKRVALADGRELEYDKLLIAVGGKPIVPPSVEGLGAEGWFTFTTWADSNAIASYIEGNNVSRAVVVGGGLIGLKSVEALLARGIQLTVVELADRVLAITMDQPASKLLADALSGAGVNLCTETTVNKLIARDGKVCGAVLADGTEVPCGLVIFAIGVVPDIGLAKAAGIETDRGIVVDDKMATSTADVYAAGDVAQALELLSGQKRPIPIWPTAYRQGLVAGVNMAGGEKLYQGGLAMNSVEICGLPTVSAGITAPTEDGYEVLSQLDEDKGIYRKIVLKDGRVVGSVFVGDIDRAGIITGLIRSGLKVDTFKAELLSPEFGLISLPADYRDRVLHGQGA